MSMPSAAVLIRCKRDGARLDANQLRAVAQGIGDGSWSEGQIAAFAMAVAWRGMSVDECLQFTLALCDSGQRLHWDHLPGPVLDKHSTGGVGTGISLRVALDSGAAAGRFARMVSALGGPADLLGRPDAHLTVAPVRRAVLASESGHVATIDVRALGQVVVDLGGGRTQPAQVLDHAVGLAEVSGRGDAIDAGQPLAIVHARSADAADAAVASVRRAFRIAPEAPPAVALWQWRAPAECAA